MMEGHLLRAKVRGLVDEEYLQSEDYAQSLRPEYTGPAGEEAVLQIAEVYNALTTEDARRKFHCKVLRGDKLKWGLTDEGVEAIARQEIIEIEHKNVELLQNRIRTIVSELLGYGKQPKTFHCGGFGPPGVGKTTSLIATFLFILFGEAGGGENSALEKFLKNQLATADKLPPKIAAIVRRDVEAILFVYFQCTAKNMTPAKLHTGVKRQYQVPNLLDPQANLQQVLAVIVLDEIDFAGTIATAARKSFTAELVDLTGGVMGNVGWHSDKYSRDTHHCKLFLWIGNLSPHNSRSSFEDQQESIYRQLKGDIIRSEKFTSDRMVSAMWIINLRCVTMFPNDRVL